MGVSDGGGLPAGVDGESAVREKVLFPRDRLDPVVQILFGKNGESS
jgi:hypothetical protein